MLVRGQTLEDEPLVFLWPWTWRRSNTVPQNVTKDIPDNSVSCPKTWSFRNTSGDLGTSQGQVSFAF